MSAEPVSREERLGLLLRNAMSMIGEMVQRHPAALKQLRSRRAPAWIRDEENVLELAHVETERAAQVVDWIAEGRDEGIFRTWREIRAVVPGAPIPLFASYEAMVGGDGPEEVTSGAAVEDGAPPAEDGEAERPGEATADDEATDDEARKPDRRQGRRRRPRPGAGEEE